VDYHPADALHAMYATVIPSVRPSIYLSIYTYYPWQNGWTDYATFLLLQRIFGFCGGSQARFNSNVNNNILL